MRLAKLVAWPSSPAMAWRHAVGIFERLRRAPCSRRTRHARGASSANCASPARKRCAAASAAGMQLRIAAGQPATVAALRWCLVGERREGHDLGAGPPPAGEDVRIDEGEGRVGGERDALAGRRQGGGNARPMALANGRRAGDHRVEIEMALGHVGEAIETRGEICMLAGLHQAEMALGQCQRLVARQRADDRHAQRGDGVGDQRAVAFAADTVEHDTGDAHGRVVGGKAAHHRCRRLRLAAKRRAPGAPADAKARREVGGRAAAPGQSGMPSNRPMTPSITSSSASLAAPIAKTVEQRPAASPSCRD